MYQPLSKLYLNSLKTKECHKLHNTHFSRYKVVNKLITTIINKKVISLHPLPNLLFGLIYVSMVLQTFVGPWWFVQFLNLFVA
jgi:hypothetical protein